MVSDNSESASEDKFYVGRIRNISGVPGSGLWQIYFDNGEFCYIEAGHGLRTVARCYGSLEEARGKTIRYRTDDLNVMAYFETVK